MSPKNEKLHNNMLLIQTMKAVGQSLWYKTDVDTSDIGCWRMIGRKTRFKVAWLQTTWFNLREQYVHDRCEEMFNHSKTPSEFLQEYKEHLNFLESNSTQWTQLLAITAQAINVRSDDRLSEFEFCITEEDLNNVDDDNTDSVNVFHELADSESEIESNTDVIEDEQITKCEKKNDSVKSNTNDAPENPSKVIKTGDKRKSERCEDTIFGELVTAMLVKMDPVEKKRVKKEIMNILL